MESSDGDDDGDDDDGTKIESISIYGHLIGQVFQHIPPSIVLIQTPNKPSNSSRQAYPSQ